MLNIAAAESLCGVSMDLSDHTLNVNVPVKFGTIGSDSPVTTASTLYYIRERIIDNGDCSFDCSVFIDETPNWGAGVWYAGSIIGEDYPASGHCTAEDKDIRGVSFPGSLTWGSLAPNQVNLTECLLSDITENAVSYSYERKIANPYGAHLWTEIFLWWMAK